MMKVRGAFLHVGITLAGDIVGGLVSSYFSPQALEAEERAVVSKSAHLNFSLALLDSIKVNDALAKAAGERLL